MPSSGAVMAPSFERTAISVFSPKERDASMDSQITIGKPTAIADSRNRSGRMGVCHSGCIFGPAMTISVPSDDWCRVERTTPAMMKMNIVFDRPRSSTRRSFSVSASNRARRPGRDTRPMNLSVTMGRNSM